MAGVDDFDADGPRIDIAFAGPPGHARMPGAAFFGDVRENRAVLVHSVVGANLCFGIAQSLHCRRASGHAGVMEEQDIDGRVERPLIEIRRGCRNEVHQTPSAASSCVSGTRRSTIATRASVIIAPTRIRGVNGSPRMAIPPSTPIAGLSSRTEPTSDTS